MVKVQIVFALFAALQAQQDASSTEDPQAGYPGGYPYPPQGNQQGNPGVDASTSSSVAPSDSTAEAAETTAAPVKYDCNAESYAQQAVNTCRRTELPAHSLGGHKQNLFIFNNPYASQQQAVLYKTSAVVEDEIVKAIATWWSQLARFGMRSNMMFYQSEFKRGASNVLNWAKMAWWNTKRVGCAAKNCGSFYAVSCMYNPGGAIVNQYVYQVGAVCSGCPSGQCDGQALCRW
ncbi:SCP-like protein [Ancylostoma caninum]|uniref:SCP-like protein n=1 Tax=Ancylostoma caninum TaxID=29170 RepID=A0A368GUA7_ANCCA|nr:SCP-like protein [Ancylostoma caninum]